MVTITATYSPEDNKLRLYPSARLDAETYQRVKAAGFIWAPKQELFVAPKWTPGREDLAIELAGDIEAEEMTLAERAQVKAERLDNLAAKRRGEAESLHRHASELSQAFYMGQPILIGHHSERKARKTKERMDAAQTKASKAEKLANYWLYRAEGVECFANMKNNPRVRANRIKTLLAELRDLQRGINAAHHAREIWEKLTTDEQIRHALGNLPPDVTLAGFGTYSKVHSGEMTPAEARDQALAAANARINGPNRKRWIEHILNRLAFERSLLGPVARFGGELTPVILQAFAREHGAEKPKASVVDDGFFLLESPVPLPAHLVDGDRPWLELSADEWRDVMQACGYEVPTPKPRRASSKPAPAPLVNLTAAEAEQLQRIWNLQMKLSCRQSGREAQALENSVKTVTQAIYSRNSGGSYSPFETIEIDREGRRVVIQWRGSERTLSGEAVARIRIFNGGSDFYKPRAIVHISDKPAKALPLDLDAIERGVRATLDGWDRAHDGPFDPARLEIIRKRFSTCQGEVELIYNGRRIEQYGDTIRLINGEYQGYSDDHWRNLAERVLSERKAAA